MVDLIRKKFGGKKVVLLGFGREGQATYALLRKVLPGSLITIADKEPSVEDQPLLKGDPLVKFLTGPGYTDYLEPFDFIIRSPGIPVHHLVSGGKLSGDRITSQTALFLERYSHQVIGVTGTKGKSTTSSLIHHILKTAGTDTVLLGNIGNPAFHFLDRIGPETRIVFELSSHQLEDIRHSPRIAVLLNLFQEHLDAYPGYREYQRAKVNITEFQKETDFLVYNADDLLVTENLAEYRYARNCFPFSIQRIPEKGSYICDGSVFFTDGSECERVWEIHQDRFLRGEHNLKNIAAAVGVVKILGTNNEAIEDGIATFKGLRHRLEYLGVFRDIHFYDDSIATIPEACMEAMKAVPDVDTLVAGGFDRGIDYSGLARFLAGHPVHNLILAGAAGRRIGEELGKYDVAGKKIFFINRFDDCAGIIFSETRPGTACILSPAAASYDEFNNFEERGDRFRKIAGVEG